MPGDSRYFRRLRRGAGTFYEGVLTAGYPPAATERAVQAGIAAAGYAPYAASGG